MTAFLMAGFLLYSVRPLGSQSPPSFEVASVKPNNSSDAGVYFNFPLGPGDVYVSNGGHFTATNLPLITYIYFAYKIMGNQSQSLLSQLPGWVTADRFDIQARTDGDPAKDTKDQMRLMMRSLLADRFNLATHYETRQVPVFGLMLVKPGKTGPRFQPHPADSCPPVSAAASPTTVAGGYPALCGGLLQLPPGTPGSVRMGARNVTMAFIANLLSSLGNLGRPVLDRTELQGTFDFVLEWVPAPSDPAPAGPDFEPNAAGPSFLEALKEQLGLRLDSQKGPSEVLVVDHVGHPSEN